MKVSLEFSQYTWAMRCGHNSLSTTHGLFVVPLLRLNTSKISGQKLKSVREGFCSGITGE